MEKYNWIFGICSSTGDCVDMFRFNGTKEGAKAKLLSFIEEDRYNADEPWEYGTETLENVQEYDDGYELYGYGCYQTYHTDYSAKEVSHIVIV